MYDLIMNWRIIQNNIQWIQVINLLAFLLIYLKGTGQSWDWKHNKAYRQVSNIRRISAGNKIVDNSDVVGASPVGAAPTTSSFST